MLTFSNPLLRRPALHTLTCLVASSLAFASAAGLASPNGSEGDAIDALWLDGHAEVSGYRWSGSRYGEARAGEAVAIFVTEPFNTRLNVKADRSTGADVVTAMKLNLVRDFQTGLYDYNTMTSVFVDTRDLSPMKSTFSSAEWCGHVFEEIDVQADRPEVKVQSYFEGESGTTTLEPRPGGLIGDQILVWARGLHGAPLQPGESTQLPYVHTSFERRMRHRQAAWLTAEITRRPQTVQAEIPAGTFEAIAYDVQLAGRAGGAGLIQIEAASPHRVLSWSWSSGRQVVDSGELLGSRRLRYWELAREGQEAMRTSIGLSSKVAPR